MVLVWNNSLSVRHFCHNHEEILTCSNGEVVDIYWAQDRPDGGGSADL
jgi:hypothetical protein